VGAAEGQSDVAQRVTLAEEDADLQAFGVREVMMGHAEERVVPHPEWCISKFSGGVTTGKVQMRQALCA